MPTEIIESKEIYRGFIALRLATLRLANGARVSREIIEHGKAAVALLNDGRRGAVMLVLARVGLSVTKCGRDRSDDILLTTFGVAAQEFSSLGSTRRTRFDENPAGVSSSAILSSTVERRQGRNNHWIDWPRRGTRKG
jgi:hypothetical protein